MIYHVKFSQLSCNKRTVQETKSGKDGSKRTSKCGWGVPNKPEKTLKFADDIAMTTTSVKDMAVQLKSLNSESKRIGLKIHKGKTKLITNDTSESIAIENEQIEKAESNEYLGQTVKMLNNTREEVLIIIKAGWRCFEMYKEILCDSKESLIQRKRIFNQCVLPPINCGCETWNITKFLEQKLVIAQHAMERKKCYILHYT